MNASPNQQTTEEVAGIARWRFALVMAVFGCMLAATDAAGDPGAMPTPTFRLKFGATHENPI